MPDTGASQSIVSAARDAYLKITPTCTELRNASGGIMRLLGEASVVLCNDRHSTQSTALVAADLNHSALIGWQDLFMRGEGESDTENIMNKPAEQTDTKIPP